MKTSLLLIKDKIDFDFDVTYKNKQGNWSKWHKISEWYSLHDFDPNYRQIFPNEIVLETDLNKDSNFSIMKQIINILNKNNISYVVFFSGNKSYHVHVFFSDLSNFCDELRTKLKKKWCEVLFKDKDFFGLIDSSNFGKRSLILIPDAINPKTGQKKSLVCNSVHTDLNVLSGEVVSSVSFSCVLKKFDKFTGAPDFCGACELALREKFPEGCRHNNLSVNVVPYLSQFNNYEELKEKYLFIQFGGSRVNDLKGWEDKKSSFNCKQLQLYMKSIGKGLVCDLCLLEGII
jgi:hypothetical protein